MKHFASTIILCLLLIHSTHAQRETIVVADNSEKKEDTASPKYWIENNEVRTEHYISFAPGKAEILPAGIPALNAIKNYMGDKNYISLLRVEGHVTCGPGAQALSEARARAVCNWLIAHGVNCRRLLPVGFGCSKPLLDEHNEMNARITFVNAALRERPIGGMPVDGGGKVAGDSCKE